MLDAFLENMVANLGDCFARKPFEKSLSIKPELPQRMMEQEDRIDLLFSTLMTAQINDGFRYRNKEYSLAGISEGELFDPAVFDLKPTWSCTACYRGYRVTYSILNSHLIISDLHINLVEDDKGRKRQQGPTINGVTAVEPGKKLGFFFNNTYADLNLHMEYSGGLLIADGFIRELYVHMGFHSAWKYETVFELIFENGILVEECDRSKKMAELRQQILESRRDADSGVMPTKSEIQSFIERAFDRKYTRDL